MVNLTMRGQYFSLETVISGIYAKFPIRMMLSPNSTLDVRMDFSLPEWSLDYLLFKAKSSKRPSKEMSYDFVWGQSVAETFSHAGAV